MVFVEIETLGETLEREEVYGTIEAVKTVSDMFMPVTGKIIQVNEKLADTPEIVNSDPYGEGWMIRIEIANPAQLKDLLSAEQYEGIANS